MPVSPGMSVSKQKWSPAGAEFIGVAAHALTTYVTNERDNIVRVVDLDAGKTMQAIEVGQWPRRVVLTRRFRMKAIGLIAFLLMCLNTAMAASPHFVDPDWPCQQVKVDTLSVASFWTGPAIDPAKTDWRQDAAVSTLVAAITQRKLPLDLAAARIVTFAKTADNQKQRALSLVFAGVFEVLNSERETVLGGLDRFGKRQKQLASDLRQEIADLRLAQAATPPDEENIATQTQRLLWDRQFFETRRQTLSFACDVPGTIEQRLFGLTKVIQDNLE